MSSLVKPFRFASRPRATTLAVLAALCGLVQAQPAAVSASASAGAKRATPPAAAASAAKDVVLDRPAAANAAPPANGVIVPTPSAAPPAEAMPASTTPAVASAASASARGASAQDQALSAVMAELALDLLRGQSDATGQAQVNAVVSPLSVASTLGMVHAGTTGVGARELGSLMGTTPAMGNRALSQRLPNLMAKLKDAGDRTGAFVMANRVWLDQGVVSAVPASYAQAVFTRYRADGAVVPFSQAAAARQAINGWAADKTAKRIPELLPEGAITASTRVVLTNAVYFKSRWAQPFDPAQTTLKPFFLAANTPKSVPTMADERVVRQGVVDNITVYELPFAGNEFSLMVGMPPAGHSLDAFEKDLDGIELAAWGTQLKPQNCRFEMPKFTIAPASRALKPTLEALGVKTVFGPDADLSAMLGKASKGVQLDNVFHSATIVIDEQGGEAAAATGAAATAKSFSAPAPACPVNRPFIFAVVHKATGAPLFVGKVADPSKS